MNVTVVGDGGWGTALALTLARNGHRPCVWGPDEAYSAEVRATRKNPRFMPGVELPETVEWTADPATALAGAEAVVFVVPSKYARATLERFKARWQQAGCPPVVSATKGFDADTLERMSSLISSVWGVSAAVLSGPSIAPETARGVPTAVTVAATGEETATHFQRLFSGDTFRVYTSDDVCGVEYGGALKNVIALAAGVCDGLGFGTNAKAALITRGLAEMTRLGVRLGAREHTFYGLSGIGDLMVTCMSPHSRNRTVGERLGKGEPLAEILAGMVQVAEGVPTCAGALRLANEHHISAPLMAEMADILSGAKAPAEAVLSLMRRDPRAERD